MLHYLPGYMIMTKVWARMEKNFSRLISEKIGDIEDGVKRICPSIIIEKLKD